jgi:general secretion pathway protein K
MDPRKAIRNLLSPSVSSLRRAVPIINHQSSIINPKGVALIMVLWVIAILTVVVLEFSFAMRTEVHITQNFKEDLQLYALAEGGVQRAIAELVLKQDTRIQQLRKTLKDEEVPTENKEWVTDGRAYELPSELGTTEIRIMSEGAKININTVSETRLRKIIENLGLEAEKRDIVVDSIMDWKDSNDLHRMNGAENDYYQSLEEPYEAKDANLDSIEELLLIRGVTPDLYYGKKATKKGEEGETPGRAGLKDIFSIYSQGEIIDINSATSIVLRFALGIPEMVSEAIVKAREEKAFENLADLQLRVPEIIPFMSEIQSMIAFRSTIAYYTIESKAKPKTGGASRGIKTIVKIDAREKERYKVIQWVDALY